MAFDYFAAARECDAFNAKYLAGTVVLFWPRGNREGAPERGVVVFPGAHLVGPVTCVSLKIGATFSEALLRNVQVPARDFRAFEARVRFDVDCGAEPEGKDLRETAIAFLVQRFQGSAYDPALKVLAVDVLLPGGVAPGTIVTREPLEGVGHQVLDAAGAGPEAHAELKKLYDDEEQGGAS